jgi:hypothetical protein
MGPVLEPPVRMADAYPQAIVQSLSRPRFGDAVAPHRIDVETDDDP